MEEKELKTSVGQRIFIGTVGVLMLGSMIAGYALIVANGGKSASGSGDESSAQISEEKIAKYEEEYAKKVTEFSEKTKGDFEKFIQYKSEIKAYNETSANENGVQKKDLKEGSGKTLEEGDSEYLAYYAGWCADGTVFDSSFDSDSNPTAFAKVLDASLGMIEGWTAGVEGMKVGGVRRITVPGELAYGESMEICGGYNKPLRFLIMAVAKEEPLVTLATELDTAYMKLQYANYGIDYEAMMEGE